MKIKQATKSMIDGMALALYLAFKEHWREAWSTLEDAKEEAHELLKPEHIAIAALDNEDKVLGWIGGLPEYDGNVWELHPLAVHPDYQRQGIGRQLVTAFEAEVKFRGGITIMLGSDDEDGMTSLSGVNLYDNLLERIANIQNYKDHPYTFYQKMGYQIIGVVPDANGIGKPDILMAKRVS